MTKKRDLAERRETMPQIRIRCHQRQGVGNVRPQGNDLSRQPTTRAINGLDRLRRLEHERARHVRQTKVEAEVD
jgi:hypothetical protein